MKLSVLMTNFNEEKYINESIQSVMENSIDDFELIIVDDGSTDSSINVIKMWQKIDKRILLIRNSTNLGVAKSKNLGLTHCQGDFIAMMDADDICMPNRFESQLHFLARNPEISLCGGAMYLLMDEGNQLKKAITKNIEKSLMIQNSFNHPTIMMRRDIVDSGIFRYSPKFRHTEDYRLWTRLAFKIGLGNLETPLLQFRANKPASTSNSSKSPIRREFEILFIRFLYLLRLSRIGKCSSKDIKSFLATIVRSTIPSIWMGVSRRRQ
jgi:glycosyltransferase involved in cell wall biosynthesis